MEKGLLNPLEVMAECVQLALLGKGYTKTNPCVGAVIAKENRIISRGWHAEFGGPHAEVMAIDGSPEDVKGCDLFVTLEPCSHYGKTPPCVEKIVASGIKRVFIGVVDPNPVNAGKGIDFLKKNGVEVYIGYMEELCASIIEDFTKFITTKKPFYTIKAAQSLDGKIASSTGDSKWITSKSSRTYGHYLRAVSDAVLVGAGTVNSDDPELNIRLIKSDRDPYKIVLDPAGRMSPEAKLVTGSADKLIYISSAENEISAKAFKTIKPVMVNDMIDLDALSLSLGEMGIMNVLVEGGGRTIGSFFDAGLADRVNFFVAPVIIGGDKTSVAGKGVETIASAYKLKGVQTRQFEQDILFSANISDYISSVLLLTEQIRGCCACGCSAHKG